MDRPAGGELLYTGCVVETLTKRFRVADKALVVYRGDEITGVRHSDGSAWNVWNQELGRWEKASPDEARTFERLPMIGHVD